MENLCNASDQGDAPKTQMCGANHGVNVLKEGIRAIILIETPRQLLPPGISVIKVSSKSQKSIELQYLPTRCILSYRVASKSKGHEFLVHNIRGIEFGNEIHHIREELGYPESFEQKWLTISYFNTTKNKLKTLQLISHTIHDAVLLRSFILKIRSFKSEFYRTLLYNMNNAFIHESCTLHGKVLFKDSQYADLPRFWEIKQFCLVMDINLGALAHKIFTNCEDREYQPVSLDHLKLFSLNLLFMKDLKLSQDILNLSHPITIEQLYKILHHQGEHINPVDVDSLFHSFASCDNAFWNIWSLNLYLTSSNVTHLIEEGHESSYFDHPLNEYFISSSHNTYLMGRQVAGDSSIEGYIRALKRGCRCIELDIWNNVADPNGDPIVNHGHTFSTGIELPRVLDVIGKYAFAASTLPLILSLEVRCSPEAQRRTIKLLRHAFEESLVDNYINNLRDLPSPNDLRMKILLKVKKTSLSQNIGLDETGKMVGLTTTTNTSMSEEADLLLSPRKPSRFRSVSTRSVVDELSALGVYAQGIKFRNFLLPESKTFNHCFSLNEKAFNSVAKTESQRASLLKHNRKFLMRVYPHRMRLKSTNFIPLRFWTLGVQMVATNWQTNDIGQQINEAFFEGAKEIGYVLKPFNLRRPIIKLSLRLVPRIEVLRYNFEIRILSGRHLPQAEGYEMNPFVELEFFGEENIEWLHCSLRGPTSIVKNDGYNPVWNSRYAGSVAVRESLIFLRLKVSSSRNARVIEEPKETCFFVCNMLRLKQGLRLLPLKDLNGNCLTNLQLLVHINITPA